MSKQMKKMLIIVGIVFALIFGWYGAKKMIMAWFMSHYNPPAVTVSATTASEKIWQSYLESVGNITAVNGVDISAEVPGIVKEIRYSSGQMVKKGDVLVTLDTSIEEAQLKNDQAQLKLAQISYTRDLTLLNKKAIPQASFDTTQAKLEQAQADLEERQARIKQKTILAPFDGKIGINLIDIGQYLPAGTAMVTLQSMDPLHVKFNLPEQYVANLYNNQPVDITVTGVNGAIKGTITAINAKVDQITRNILVMATISNQNGSIYPGMYAGVKIWLRGQKNVIVLPQTAISYSLHGDSVFIIKNESKDKKDQSSLKAYRQYVTVGERRGGEVAITSGLKAGDQVVTTGQLKLQNGTQVAIDNSVEL